MVVQSSGDTLHLSLQDLFNAVDIFNNIIVKYQLDALTDLSDLPKIVRHELLAFRSVNNPEGRAVPLQPANIPPNTTSNVPVSPPANMPPQNPPPVSMPPQNPGLQQDQYAYYQYGGQCYERYQNFENYNEDAFNQYYGFNCNYNFYDLAANQQPTQNYAFNSYNNHQKYYGAYPAVNQPAVNQPAVNQPAAYHPDYAYEEPADDYHRQQQMNMNVNEKPDYSYFQLIVQAIISSETKKCTLNDIYSFITKTYPYYSSNEKGWQNSIRHNLSLSNIFVKCPRANEEPGKGSYWYINPENYHDTLSGAFVPRRIKCDAKRETNKYTVDNIEPIALPPQPIMPSSSAKRYPTFDVDTASMSNTSSKDSMKNSYYTNNGYKVEKKCTIKRYPGKHYDHYEQPHF